MNTWQELGKHLENTARDVSQQSTPPDQSFLLSVHILLDENGNPIDWLGPNLREATTGQWQALRSANNVANAKGAAVETEETAVKRQAVYALIKFLQTSTDDAD